MTNHDEEPKLLIEHTMWSTSKMCSWMRFSATQLMATDVQKSVCEAIAGRLSDLAATPRDIEQNALRDFVRAAEMLDDYCMGGSRPPNYTLNDIRSAMNESANAARALLAPVHPNSIRQRGNVSRDPAHLKGADDAK